MSETMSLISAAAATVPPMADERAWEEAVRERAVKLAVMSGPKSALNQLVTELTSPEIKIFTGTVISGTMEQSSTRLFVILETGTERKAVNLDGSTLPTGQETIRTDRTDTPNGAFIARKLRALKGCKVRVWVYMESTNNPDKPTSRVLKHVEALGS